MKVIQLCLCIVLLFCLIPSKITAQKSGEQGTTVDVEVDISKEKEKEQKVFKVKLNFFKRLFIRKKNRKQASELIAIDIPSPWKSTSKEIDQTITREVITSKEDKARIMLKLDASLQPIALFISANLIKSDFIVEPNGEWDKLWNCLYTEQTANNNNKFTYKLNNQSACFGAFLEALKEGGNTPD